MSEVLEGIFAAITGIATALLVAAIAVIVWIFRSLYFGLYYAFHPHPGYLEYLP
jgi:hypothetical protein